MDDHKCVEILNLGITEKRKGNYEKALDFYEQAKLYNPHNSNIYYNSGKLLCGLGKNEEAIKNFLTYAHYNILNDSIIYNPINIIAIKNTSERIEKAEYTVPLGYTFSSDWLKILTNNDRLPFLFVDDNLLFYTGFSFLADKSIFVNHYSINQIQIQDLKNGLLGKPSHVYLKNEEYEIIIMCFGLVLLLKNLKINTVNPADISKFYLKNNYSIISPIIENKDEVDNFLDRNPENKELDNFMTQKQKIIKDELSLKNVYLGYNLLTPAIFDDPGMQIMDAANIGHTSTIGFDREMLKKLIIPSRDLYLCYFALPIDDDDYLVENDMLDWDFESYLTKKFKVEFVSIGSLKKNEYKRCRTFKFLYEIQKI